MHHAYESPARTPRHREGRRRCHHGQEPLARLSRARPISPTCSSTPIPPSRWRTSPRSTTPRSRGAGANILLAAGDQEGGLHPRHRGGQARRRPGREGARGGHGRLHRHDQAPARRSRLREQGARKAVWTTSPRAPAATTASAPSAAGSTPCWATPYTDIEKAGQEEEGRWSSAAAPAAWKRRGSRPSAATT